MNYPIQKTITRMIGIKKKTHNRPQKTPTSDKLNAQPKRRNTDNTVIITWYRHNIYWDGTILHVAQS